ncbi:MAG: TetR/AcrR family transcriptional regulator [Gammaproteobacteria bacterium]|nr:TetR/AcrR family transcriptional regulator [Gammaproteobacteria bacterium]
MNAKQSSVAAEPEAPHGHTGARERIFKTARDLFYRQGIRAVGVETIAAESGTTKMSLYRHFTSKDELVAECLKDQDREFWEWWDSVTGPYQGRPRRQIEALFEAFETRCSCDRTQRGCAIVNAAVEIIDDDHPALRIVQEHHDEMLRRLRALCREMGARRPDKLGDALLLLIGGSFVCRLIFHKPGPVGSVADAARILIESAEFGATVE